MTRIVVDDPGRPECVRLLAALNQHLDRLYPPESCHRLDIGSLGRPEVTFVTARDGSVLLGCGALVANDGWGEVKRMMVDPGARGRGVGRALLRRLEAEALARGLTCLRLETGIHQPEATALYRSAGYAERPPYAGYVMDPVSIFMEKMLPAVRFRRAIEVDSAALQAMVTAFHAGEGRATGERTLRAVAAVARGEPMAEAWMIELTGRAVGYMILTRGWGIEYGGPDLFLDELYLAAEARGVGLGPTAMVFAERRARELGALALFLVVAPRNDRARRLYEASGYETSDWVLMGRHL